MASDTLPGPKERTLRIDRMFACDPSTRDAIRNASPDYRRAQMQHFAGLLDDDDTILAGAAKVALEALSELEAWDVIQRARSNRGAR